MPSSSRRFLILLIGASTFLGFTFLLLFRNQSVGASGVYNASYRDEPIHHVDVSADTLRGEVIMPKLGNETLKYASPPKLTRPAPTARQTDSPPSFLSATEQS